MRYSLWSFICLIDRLIEFAPTVRFSIDASFQVFGKCGAIVTVFSKAFGIEPKAFEKTVTIAPHLPKTWNEASIENLTVGANSINLSIKQMNDHKEYRIHQTQKDWT